MSRTTTDTEALGKAANALSTYISEVKQSVKVMQDAAVDCRDNMDKDRLSERAISNLSDCVKKIDKALVEAESLRKMILKKKKEVEDLARGM